MTDATNGEALLPELLALADRIEDRAKMWGEAVYDHGMAWARDLREICNRQPTASAGMVVVPEDAPKEFVDYFVKNYPGPDTTIGNPRWHAPRIWRAARHAMLAAHESQSPNRVNPAVAAQLVADLTNVETMSREVDDIVESLNADTTPDVSERGPTDNVEGV